MTVGQITFALGTAVYVLIATVLEERDLVAELGDAYRTYRVRVPAFLPHLRLTALKAGPTSRGRPESPQSAVAPQAAKFAAAGAPFFRVRVGIEQWKSRDAIHHCAALTLVSMSMILRSSYVRCAKAE
jgi:hypothetical protein